MSDQPFFDSGYSIPTGDDQHGQYGRSQTEFYPSSGVPPSYEAQPPPPLSQPPYDPSYQDPMGSMTSQAPQGSSSFDDEPPLLEGNDTIESLSKDHL